jgi:predicted RNA-binding Zn-ribbon protein involved in translation (DUF1610 family)
MPIHVPLDGANWAEKLPPICPKCGYNLMGAPSARCPECGWRIVWRQLQRDARTAFYSLKIVDDVNDLVDFGPYLAGATGVLFFSFRFIGWPELGSAVTIFFALGTFLVGLQVFRVRGIPEYARAQMKHQPKRMKGAIVSALGVFIALLALFL